MRYQKAINSYQHYRLVDLGLGVAFVMWLYVKILIVGFNIISGMYINRFTA
jgi:hypothetical protein